MSVFSLIQSYLLWHYVYALRDAYFLVKNILWLLERTFSLSLLFRTLFSPWHRLHEDVPRFFANPGEFLSNTAINMIMRILGFVVRVTYIFIALLASSIVIVMSVFFVPVWYMLPAFAVLAPLVPFFL